MIKSYRSWSVNDEIPNLIAIKKVDWSVFEYGSHLPLELHKAFEEVNSGKHLERGERQDVTLLIDGQSYSATLINVDRNNVAADTLQLRYDTNRVLKELLKNKFGNSYRYLKSEREKKNEVGENGQVNVPEDRAEYIYFYRTGTPFCYRLELQTYNHSEKEIDLVTPEHTPNIWWVNQGHTLSGAESEGILWSPLLAKDGRKIYHWENMAELQKGDIVIHYASGAIRYVSQVIERAIESPSPVPSKNHLDLMGRLVRVQYHPINPEIALESFSKKLLELDIALGPLDKNGEVKQGYLFKINVESLIVLQEIQPETIWPEFTKIGVPNINYSIAKGKPSTHMGLESFKDGNINTWSTQEEPSQEAEIVYNPDYTLSQLSDEVGIGEEELARWIRAIKRKGQAILYGPPGTGKTYVAERLAKFFIANGNGFSDLVQFHPAYAYEDFIQGIRPKARENGGLDYPLVPGRFLEFSNKARKRQGTSVLIVDEINRANLARVFGELMFLLEYRDREVPLAGGGKFSIPANVIIVGTMNTADRSIALVDHALRRRFAFLSLQPNYEILRHFHRGSNFPIEGLIETLLKLNKQIADLHYEIGVSFFLTHALGNEIEDIWRMEIEPYLEEYFFDQPDKVKEFSWEKVKGKIIYDNAQLD